MQYKIRWITNLLALLFWISWRGKTDQFFFPLPPSENDPAWASEIQDDVIEECNKHGGVVHIYVDKNSPQVGGSIQSVMLSIFGGGGKK